jgi:beta-glucosidase
MRLLGFERVALEPGASRQVTLTADPRLLARFDTSAGAWRIAGGPIAWRSAKSADDFELTGDVILAARLFGS